MEDDGYLMAEWNEGWNAYMDGKVCPYEKDTEQRRHWEAGFEAAADFWPEQSR